MMESPLAISAFVVGVTALVKRAGVPGKYLALVCVLAGGFASYMVHYQPELWANLSEVLIALTSTGLVSFADDRLQRMRPPA